MAMFGSINGLLMEGTQTDDAWTLQQYVARGGYSQLKRILESKMTQEDVNQIIEKHQHGLQIRFKNCDLSGLDLSGRVFENIIFEDS